MPRSRPRTPEPAAMDDAQALGLLNQSRLGRMMEPIAVALNRLQLGEAVPPQSLDLGRLASRIEMMNNDFDRYEAGSGAAQPGDVLSPEAWEAVERQIDRKLRSQLVALNKPDASKERVLVAAPTSFAASPTLGTAARVEERKVKFTCLNARARFSGTRLGPDKGEFDIVSLLESLNRGQEQMVLTETEFLNVLISSTTGKAQDTLVDFLKLNGEGSMSVSDIYLRLTDQYFFDLRPDQAKTKLRGLSQGKHPFTSLAEADNLIARWAKLAALSQKTSESRAMMREMHYKDTMIRIIPDKYQSVVIQQIDQLEYLEKREVRSHEILGLCRAFRSEIDSLFYKRSSGVTGKSNTVRGSSKKGKNLSTNQDGSVHQVRTRSQTSHQTSDSAPPVKALKGKKKGSGQSASPSGSQPKGNPGNKKQKDKSLSSDKCLLCGQTSHRFDCCPLFKAHERIVAGTPCPCPLQSLHLQKFCPLKSSVKN